MPGVGPRTERRLWDDGVVTLEDFVAAARVRGISRERKRLLDADAVRALEAHAGADARYFAGRLPHAEAWRMYPRFAGECAFLDIETTGFSRQSAVTVVGVYRPGRGFGALIRGQGLSATAITEALEGSKLLVTFNGAGFDLPVLRTSFPSARFPPAHLDLLSCARRLDWRGGLKIVERIVGISRDQETRVLAGSDAVRLWRAWERSGSQNALRLLIKYNRADVEGLETVAAAAVERLTDRLNAPAMRGRRQLALPAA